MSKNINAARIYGDELEFILQQNKEVRVIQGINTETDQMSATYLGSPIIAANSLVVGDSIKLHTHGQISTGNSQQGNQRIKLNGTDIVTSLNFLLPNGLSNVDVVLDVEIKILTTGVNGTCIILGGSKIYDPSSTKYRQLTQLTPQPINTTIDNTIQ